MTTTARTSLIIHKLSPQPVEIEIDYTYSPRHQELVIEGASVRIDGREKPVLHLLSPTQHRRIEDDCVRDYYDRIESARELNRG